MPRIVDREPRGKVVEDFATHTLMVVNKEADQMTPNQRLKLREEFRRKRKERQEAEIRERRKIAKVITGDEAKMLQLEVFLGPQDDIPRLEDALVEIGELRINRLSEMLGMFDPKGLQASGDRFHQKEAVAKLLGERVFTTPLQPENMLPLLELRTETKRLSDRDLDAKHSEALKEVRAVAMSLPYDEKARESWSKLLPKTHLTGRKAKKPVDLKDPNNSEIVINFLRQLTLSEWKVLKEIAAEGITEKEAELMGVVAEKTGLNGADSAVHVLIRALHVLNRTARVQDMEGKHIIAIIGEVMADLKKKGANGKGNVNAQADLKTQ